LINRRLIKPFDCDLECGFCFFVVTEPGLRQANAKLNFSNQATVDTRIRLRMRNTSR